MIIAITVEMGIRPISKSDSNDGQNNVCSTSANMVITVVIMTAVKETVIVIFVRLAMLGKPLAV